MVWWIFSKLSKKCPVTDFSRNFSIKVIPNFLQIGLIISWTWFYGVEFFSSLYNHVGNGLVIGNQTSRYNEVDLVIQNQCNETPVYSCLSKKWAFKLWFSCFTWTADEFWLWAYTLSEVAESEFSEPKEAVNERRFFRLLSSRWSHFESSSDFGRKKMIFLVKSISYYI